MYKLTNTNTIIRLADDALIPPDPANSDYVTYQVWLAQGNTPDPVDPPTPDQIAALAEATRFSQDSASAKAYNKLHALSLMSPAQVQTWVAANVTNLAQAQDAIATLAIAVSVLIRRL